VAPGLLRAPGFMSTVDPRGAVSNELTAVTPVVPPKVEARSYPQILRSTALIGGSSVVNIALGIVRTKATAAMLGPSGVGLFGLFNSVADLSQSVVGLGVQSSGVRQIAEAAASDAPERVATTAAVLRRVCLGLAVIGAVMVFAFAKPISRVTFGTDVQTAGVAALSIAVFLRVVSSGQSALVHGLRRVGDLAKMSVIGTWFGCVATIALVYVLRERGIVPSIIASAGMLLVMSWWYSRRVDVRRRAVTTRVIRTESVALLSLGFALMASDLMALTNAYLSRIIVLHQAGIAATGLYQAAWTLGGLYVGFILQAMGADFYPRLTAAADDHDTCNRLVNEQAHIGLLLAGPGALATLTLAPTVLSVFYSSRFAEAVDVLRWISVGAALRVITWPIGFIVVAKGYKRLLVFCEVAWAVVSVACTWFAVKFFGLAGAGMAFAASYVFHWILIYVVVRRITGFSWSTENMTLGVWFLSAIAGVFTSFAVLPPVAALTVGLLVSIVAGGYSLRALTGVMPERWTEPVTRRLPGALADLLRPRPVVSHAQREAP